MMFLKTYAILSFYGSLHVIANSFQAVDKNSYNIEYMEVKFNKYWESRADKSNDMVKISQKL